MLSLAELSLEQIRQRGVAAIRQETEVTLTKLRTQLGAEALPTGVWNNGMGQAGLLVTRRGLDLLEQANEVKALQLDTTRGLRDLAWMSLHTGRAIESALRTSGEAIVEIVLNSEIGYEIGSSGQTVYRPSAAAATEHVRMLQRLQSKAGAGLRIIDDRLARQGASARVAAQIDRAAYHALRMAPEVRALLVEGVRPSLWSEDVLAAAAAADGARVILSLHGADSFSPYQGYMSPSSWAAQSVSHRAALDALLAEIDAQPVEPVLDAGVGSLSAWLSQESLQTLYARRDPRVRAVELVKPMGGPALSTSMSAPLVNMAPAWAAGYRGAGQAIFILDTGVRKDHEFFKGSGSASASRVIAEACFGTTSGGYVSICPPPPNPLPPGTNYQVGPGDSLVGTVGSGMPYNNANYCAAQAGICSHGTHAAGIAAGRSQPSLSPAGIQGMMPDAQLVAVQIHSFPANSSGGPRWFNEDLLEALKAVERAAQNLAQPVTPYVVNASITGSTAIGTCDGDLNHSAIAPKVGQLMSLGVPFVAATGNGSSNQYITFPACLGAAVKVSAVVNAGSGSVRLANANLADPASFAGPILLAPGGGVIANGEGVTSSSATTTTSMIPLTGTSFATPHVSGMLAGVKAAIPGVDVANSVAWIMGTGSIAVNVQINPPPAQPKPFRRIRYPGP